MIYGRLVSLDENETIIIAEIDDSTFTDEFYNQILELGESYEGPETIYVAGSPIVEGELGKLAPEDMKRMAPIVSLIIVIVLLLILRSFKGTVLNLFVVMLSTVWTFGLMALLDIPIFSVSTMIPVMLIAIGVAYGIHLFSHLELYMQKNPSATKREAIENMMKHMWKPVLMTAVTTAVGFTSLVTSEVYPVKYFGLFTAFGVMSALLFSLVLIPAGLMIVGLPKPKQFKMKKSSGGNFAFKFADMLAKKKSLTIFIAAIVIAVSLFGISRVWINSSFLANFEKDSDIVRTDRFINENFAGTGYKGLVFTDLILKGQISSLFLSIIIVIILVAVMFKNFIIGLIASVPILITAMVNFGAMGLLNVALGPTTALISSIAVGIGIDYAIHFIDRYKEYSIETGDKNETARLTMYNTGRAILFNAVVVIAGFLVLMFSMFPPNRQLGALVSLNMFSSFLGTLTIMFLLLYLSNIYFKSGNNVSKGEKK